MSPDDFKAWRKAMGYSQDRAANALGLSRTAVQNYDTGVRRGDGGRSRSPSISPWRAPLFTTAWILGRRHDGTRRSPPALGACRPAITVAPGGAIAPQPAPPMEGVGPAVINRSHHRH